MEEDGFVKVCYKKKKKHKNLKNFSCKFDSSSSTDSLSTNTINLTEEKLQSIERDLLQSEFFSGFKEQLIFALEQMHSLDIQKGDFEIKPDEQFTLEKCSMINDSEVDIICYGLGKFFSCPIALHQLACLLALKKHLKPRKLLVYDPVHSETERLFLNKFDINVLEINEECKRKVESRTIFFMPHCDLPLYDNLLWANWSKTGLCNMIIIGNRLRDYHLPFPLSKLKELAYYVYTANDFLSEIKIVNNYVFPDIFNDISIHYFPVSSLNSVCSVIWDHLDEPQHSIQSYLFRTEF